MGATVEKVTLAYSVITEFDSLTSSISHCESPLNPRRHFFHYFVPAEVSPFCWARRMRGLSDTPLQIEVVRHRYIEPILSDAPCIFLSCEWMTMLCDQQL